MKGGGRLFLVRTNGFLDKGAQIADNILASQAVIKFTVVVEIKKPNTPLLKPRYRNGGFPVSDELAGGVSQVQSNSGKWEIEGSRLDSNRVQLAEADIYTVQPKGILVIGDTQELNLGVPRDQLDKKMSFQRFRRNVSNPEIITFDELYERAKYITENEPMELNKKQVLESAS